MERPQRERPPRPDRFGRRVEDPGRSPLGRRRDAAAPPSDSRPAAERPGAALPAPSAGTGKFLTFVVFATLTLLALNAWLLTGRAAGERIQRRAVAELTEIDRYVAVQGDAINAAATSAADEVVAIPEYPIPVSLPRSEAVQADRTALRDAILDRAARTVYEDGPGAFDGAGGAGRSLSPSGVVRLFMENVTQARNLAFLLAAVGFGLLTVSVGTRLAQPLPAPARLGVLGRGVVAASAVVLALSLAAWAGLLLAEGNGGGIRAALTGLARDMALAAAVNSLITAGLGLAAVAVAAVLQRRGEPPGDVAA